MFLFAKSNLADLHSKRQHERRIELVEIPFGKFLVDFRRRTARKPLLRDQNGWIQAAAVGYTTQWDWR